MRPLTFATASFLILSLGAANAQVPPPNTPNLPTQDGAVLAVWTQFVAGPDLNKPNRAIELRYVLRGDKSKVSCDAVSVQEDGKTQATAYWRGEMTEADPTTAPNPMDYTVQVCGAALAATTQKVTLMQGKAVAQVYNGADPKVAVKDLPGPAMLGSRVGGQITGIALGDSGCRGLGEGQDCNRDWVLKELAADAVKHAPDFVLHVGDYHYFYEHDKTFWDRSYGGNRFGYFLQEILVPAGPLLRAAPWILSRGNHERCKAEWVGSGYHTLFGPRDYKGQDGCKVVTPPSAIPGVPATWAVDLAPSDGSVPSFRFFVIDNVNAGQNSKANYNDAAKAGALEDGAQVGWISHYPPMKMAQWSGTWHYGEATVQANIKNAFGSGVFPCQKGKPCLPTVTFSGHQHFYQEFTFDDDSTPVISIVGHGGVGISPNQQPGYQENPPVLASRCHRGFAGHMPFQGGADKATLLTAQYHGYVLLKRNAATTDRTGWTRTREWLGLPNEMTHVKFKDIGECPHNH